LQLIELLAQLVQLALEHLIQLLSRGLTSRMVRAQRQGTMNVVYGEPSATQLGDCVQPFEILPSVATMHTLRAFRCMQQASLFVESNRAQCAVRQSRQNSDRP
jgi:hypothetical protein